jgi:hypothetical protein
MGEAVFHFFCTAHTIEYEPSLSDPVSFLSVKVQALSLCFVAMDLPAAVLPNNSHTGATANVPFS